MFGYYGYTDIYLIKKNVFSSKQKLRHWKSNNEVTVEVNLNLYVQNKITIEELTHKLIQGGVRNVLHVTFNFYFSKGEWPTQMPC